MAVTYEDLDVAVNKKFLPFIVNQFFRATPVLTRLMSKNNVVLKGGRKIAQPVVYDELPGGSYSGLDTFDTAYKQTHTYAEWDWKSNYVNVTIPGDELDKADSDEAIIGLLTPKMETASSSMNKLMATQMYGDGTGNGSKDMDGFQNAIDDGTTYATYGTLTRTTETWWQANYDGTGGVLTLDLLQTAYGNCTDGDIQPDLIVMRQALWNKLWGKIQPQQRFVDEKLHGDLAKIGFSVFSFNKAAVVADNYVLPSDAIYVLNTNYIKLIINQNRNFTWTPPKQPTDQDAYIRQLIVRSNLICTAPWRSEKILNVT